MNSMEKSILRGLKEAVGYMDGTADKSAYRVHPGSVDVKAIRTRLGMTQKTFAASFGFSVNTLRHWEQGNREPEGPTRAYLIVIARAPDAVKEALMVGAGLQRTAGTRRRQGSPLSAQARERLSMVPKVKTKDDVS